ncbi:MAG: response regulator [Bacteroidales bacterium]|nr:response regulator [Bacteroidales bacterium]
MYSFLLINFFFDGFQFPADIIWFSFVPALTIYALGARRGSLLSGLLYIVLMVGLIIYYRLYGGLPVTGTSIIIFSVFYLFIFLISLSFEFVYQRLLIDLKRSKESELFIKKSKEDFISRLSHEIRTPLNDMVVLNNLLAQSKLNENQKSIAETLIASTTNLVNIVQSISESSSSEVSFQHKANTLFNLKSTIEGTIEFYSKKDVGEITLLLNEEKVPIDAIGNPVILKQIMLILIESIMNADTKDEKCKISLNVELDKKFDNSFTYVFDLRSNNMVFASTDQIETILTASESPEKTASLQHDLLALNILFGKKLINMLQGNLEIKINGDSTQFLFTTVFGIPGDTDQRSYEHAKVPEFEAGKPKLKLKDANLLLVEDNELNQKILKIGLKDYFRNIDVAYNGKEALDKFGTSKYDIILMDIQMQEMDGITATMKIREIEKSTNSHVPIIAVTANALLGDRETCISAGMDDYMSKPFQIDDLIEMMKKLI